MLISVAVCRTSFMSLGLWLSQYMSLSSEIFADARMKLQLAKTCLEPVRMSEPAKRRDNGDQDRHEYVSEPEYPFPTRVDDSGTRFFLETQTGFNCRYEGHITVAPRWRLLPREELQDLFRSKVVAGAESVPGMEISHVSFQAYKSQNEDRMFVHTFTAGTLLGVLDGHGGIACVEATQRDLPPLLETALTSALDETRGAPFERVSSTIEAAFEWTFLEYDASLMGPVNEVISELRETWKDEDWTDDDLLDRWYWEAQGRNRGASAHVGTCALVAFIPHDMSHVWVACAGDSQALHGRYDMVSATWTPTALNDMHNGDNPREVERIVAEHPGEEGTVVNNRLLGKLHCTRAIGDHVMKVPASFAWKYMQWMRPVWIAPNSIIEEWTSTHPTGSYLTARPTVRHTALRRGDVLVLASDGLSGANQLRALSSDMKERLITSLAGIASASGDRTCDMSDFEQMIGHSLAWPSQGDLPAQSVLSNVLFGADDVKLAAEVTMEFPRGKGQWQDDISVLVAKVI
ncbi:protein serine/threonine phosphatase 2C [Exidia glandulosa HHB12029]|uniref:Protein serine/threonine phosphatase 2C n=1 Tax=Exidia glandulosa HHB12029 TaxID=1314781 RepID=A0A165QXJ4_EXIGL|nr:protein serine/threonine phosphatase 2C [Exidia glandulosa HHB12029]